MKICKELVDTGEANAPSGKESEVEGGRLPPVPGKVGPFELDLSERFAGGSKTARVYRGKHPALDATVVVKLAPLGSPEAEVLARSARLYARAWSVPHLVRIIDAGECNGYFYNAYEYAVGVRGDRLFPLGTPVAWANAARVARFIFEALDGLHGMRIAHCDIKLANLLVFMIAGEVVRVTLVDLETGAVELQKATQKIEGTAAYLAPEVLDPMRSLVARDLFASGVVLQRMLTGMLFKAGVGYQSPLLPEDVDIPEPLRQLVARLLSAEPSQRPTACEAVEVIKRLEAGEAMEATVRLDPYCGDVRTTLLPVHRDAVRHRNAATGERTPTGVAVPNTAETRPTESVTQTPVATANAGSVTAHSDRREFVDEQPWWQDWLDLHGQKMGLLAGLLVVGLLIGYAMMHSMRNSASQPPPVSSPPKAEPDTHTRGSSVGAPDAPAENDIPWLPIVTSG